MNARANHTKTEMRGSEESFGEGRLAGLGQEESEAVLGVLAKLARYLRPDDRRIVGIAQTLLSVVAASSPHTTSSTPSTCSMSSGQAQLARCLIPLAPSLLSSGRAADEGGALSQSPASAWQSASGNALEPDRELDSLDVQVRGFLRSVRRRGGGANGEPENAEAEIGLCSAGEACLRQEMLDKFMAARSSDSISGNAFAIAGVTCGLGGAGAVQRWRLSALLNEAMADQDPVAKQRGLRLMQAIALVHGRLAEPYVLSWFPSLVRGLGDSNRSVRQAAVDCMDAVVSTLSGSGARLISPVLLDSLQNAPSWRARAAVVIALGKLVASRPRQLSGVLSMIINALAASVREAHIEVSQAACQSLTLCAKLSRCREIVSVLPVLTAALEGEPGAAQTAVQALVSVEVGELDAVALSLVLPPLRECATDSAPAVRKKSTAVAGALLSISSWLASSPSAAQVTSQRAELLALILRSLGDTDASVREIAADAIADFVHSSGDDGAHCPHVVCHADLICRIVPDLI